MYTVSCSENFSITSTHEININTADKDKIPFVQSRKISFSIVCAKGILSFSSFRFPDFSVLYGTAHVPAAVFTDSFPL